MPEINWAWFRWLNDAWGIKLTILYDGYDRGRFVTGLLTSGRLILLALAVSVIIGIVGAWAQGARFRPLRLAIGGYVQLFRCTPPLVQLYFLYFAVSPLIATTGPTGLPLPLIGNFAWAAIGLSLYAGAFNVEIFRAGIEAVPAPMMEAAEALGYSRLKAYRHILFPLAFRISLPALNNNLVNLVKTTTIAYAIAVPELLYVSAQIWSDEVNVPEMMNVLLVVYVGMVGLLIYFMGRWERAIRIPGYGI